MVATLVTQSRSDSLIASLRVREPASTPDHLGAQQLHAVHVERLAPLVLGAHVDPAPQPEQGGRGGHRDAVLPGAGLGDHPHLAHPPGEQALADRVVDLVRAGVAEVLALEEDRAPRRGAG